MTMKMMMITW